MAITDGQFAWCLALVETPVNRHFTRWLCDIPVFFFVFVQNCCNSSVCKTTDLLSRGKTYHNNYIFLQVVVVRGRGTL